MENEQFQGRVDWDNFEPGQTVRLSRREMLQDSLEGIQDEIEQDLGAFLKSLVEDLNIVAIALSNIKDFGGIYSHVFCADMQNEEAMRVILYTFGQACKSLERSGPCSFVNLGHKPFDEIEAKFREDWYRGNPNNIFDPNPPADSLDLIGIIRFD